MTAIRAGSPTQDLAAERERRAQGLLDLLQLEKIEEDLYRGTNEVRGGETTAAAGAGVGSAVVGGVSATQLAQRGSGRLFGGQVLAQALQAAYLSTVDLDVHSLHGYFLRAGSAELPVLYEVDRIRDGRSFTTRRVVGIQRGQAIFSMSASFHRVETGFDHAEPMPNVPPPDELADDVETARALLAEQPDSPLAAGLARVAREPRPFFTRSVFPIGSAQWLDPRRWNPVWIKFPVPLAQVPADQHSSTRILRHVLLAYASDMGMVSTAGLPVANAGPRSTPRSATSSASLDHALWLHRPELSDDWLLMHKHTSVAEASRGLVHAEFFSRDGLLVASVTQEGLLRYAREKS